MKLTSSAVKFDNILVGQMVWTIRIATQGRTVHGESESVVHYGFAALDTPPA